MSFFYWMKHNIANIVDLSIYHEFISENSTEVIVFTFSFGSTIYLIGGDRVCPSPIGWRT